jgi:putative hemolysin
VLRLGDRSVRTLMTPRPDVRWIDADAGDEAQIKVLTEAGYARLPLARGTLDELIGVVHTKDIVAALLSGKMPILADLARAPLTVLDGTPVLRLLELFRDTRQHLAVVVDEHGSVEGIVTATDILESVTGDLPEHFDEDDMSIVRRDDGSYLIDAMKPIDEVMAALSLKGLRSENDDFHTLAGFILKELGHLPHTGEKFSWSANSGSHPVIFEVIDMDGRRVDKVLITLPAAETDAD